MNDTLSTGAETKETECNSAVSVNAPWEDDDLRSRYVWSLVHGVGVESAKRSRGRPRIPKLIVRFWHDHGDLPEDVRECLDSWCVLENEGFRVVLFDDVQAKRFVSRRFGRRHLRAYELCHHPAMRCDYFRLCYILVNGGFYVDADDVYQGTDCMRLFSDTRLKVQALCYDNATDSMVSPDVFIGQRKCSPSWTCYVNNNPIIAPASHPIIRLALERATRILLSCRERPGIQSTTGPGNLTASLVRHAMGSPDLRAERDFEIMGDWEAIAVSQWPLSYRNDERNWRRADG